MRNKKKGMPRPSLLTKCLLGSLVLHASVFFLLGKYNSLFFKMSSPLFQRSKPFPLPIGEEELTNAIENALENFFEEFAASPQESSTQIENLVHVPPLLFKTDSKSPFSETTLRLLDAIPFEEMSLPFTAKTTDENFSSFISSSLPIPQPVKEQNIASNLSHLEELFTTTSNPPLTENISPKSPEELFCYPIENSSRTKISFELLPSLPNSKEISSIEPFFPKDSSLPEYLGKPATLPKSLSYDFLPPCGVANIEEHLPTSSLYSLAWNNAFTITPSFFPEEDGYVFSLEVMPKEFLIETKQKQTLLFLIDTSSYIEKHKVSVFKKAILKALSSLNPGDDFNIYLLDEESHAFQEAPISFSPKALQEAEEFLEKKFEKSFFSSFDLFDSIRKVVETLSDSEDFYAALLLSSGKGPSSLKQKQSSLLRLLEKSQKIVPIFTATVGKNNDLVTLDMLSSLSGGKLLYSTTNASFPRKLSSFLNELTSPLIKEVGVAIHTNDPKANISLEPLIKKTPGLYMKQPFHLMGKMDRLGAILVTLEGKSEEGWVLINQEVDFEKARVASTTTQKEWKQRQTALLYEKFLNDPKPSYLEEAKELLKARYGKACGG